MIDHFAVVPHDALQLEETLEGLLVEAKLLVREAEVVQGLHTGGVILQSHHIELLGFLQVAPLHLDEYSANFKNLLSRQDVENVDKLLI